jgi:hypothetical protein
MAILAGAFPASAQDDVTTRTGRARYGGGYITGPASNPLSFLNGPAYRTFGSAAGEFLRNTEKGPNYNSRYFAINFKDDGKTK